MGEIPTNFEGSGQGINPQRVLALLGDTLFRAYAGSLMAHRQFSALLPAVQRSESVAQLAEPLIQEAYRMLKTLGETEAFLQRAGYTLQEISAAFLVYRSRVPAG